MKKHTSNQYTEQKLSRYADIKIRTRLALILMRRVVPSTLQEPWVLASGAVAALLLASTVPGLVENQRTASFLAKVQSSQEEQSLRMQREIYTHKFVVSEGKDKAAYVAAVKDIPLSDAAQVPLRRDTIDEWRYGISNLGYIETNVPGRTVDVRLNLENDDHMHVFEYKPQDCDDQKRENITSTSCEQKALATETYRAHRTVFDGVHDIESLYEAQLAYAPEAPPVLDVSRLKPVGIVAEETGSYRTFTEETDGVQTTYYFDTKTYALKKRIISLIKDGRRYEMSEIDEIDSGFIPAEEGQRLFDPKRYTYEQIEVIPLGVSENTQG